MENGFPKIMAGHQDETDFMHSCAGLSDINLKRLALIPKTEETVWLLRIFPNYSWNVLSEKTIVLKTRSVGYGGISPHLP